MTLKFKTKYQKSRCQFQLHIILHRKTKHNLGIFCLCGRKTRIGYIKQQLQIRQKQGKCEQMDEAKSGSRSDCSARVRTHITRPQEEEQEATPRLGGQKRIARMVFRECLTETLGSSRDAEIIHPRSRAVQVCELLHTAQKNAICASVYQLRRFVLKPRRVTFLG